MELQNNIILFFQPVHQTESWKYAGSYFSESTLAYIDGIFLYFSIFRLRFYYILCNIHAINWFLHNIYDVFYLLFNTVTFNALYVNFSLCIYTHVLENVKNLLLNLSPAYSSNLYILLLVFHLLTFLKLS